ncbi:MAG TPA: heterodisulfide reductase-related iron-sulfur binding cluster [Actinomycetota bacterium]|nr:heterodisulfide reductase-related iron-sulfur binding cluster [Actinomycetota bacterium]
MDLIADCVHCGFCLPTCPTYVLWGEEMDSPRGRIVLMREWLEEDASGGMSNTMATHFDRCLGCMACVTACPSGVQYDRLIEATRPQVERNHRRSWSERALRRTIFSTTTRPGLLRALAPALAIGRRLGLTEVLPGRLARLGQLAPEVSLRNAWRTLPRRFAPRGARRGTVGLLQGCVQRVFFSDVNLAAARVLQAEGFEVVVPARPGCCGALELHSGEDEAARAKARAAVAAFEGCDHVIVTAAGCGSAMKDYRHVLADDSRWATRAAALSAKVRDISEFLAGIEPREHRSPMPMRVAYHDACHLAHAQGIRAEPRSLLAEIPELEIVEPNGWEICCGSAGVYNLLQPAPADELGRMKAERLLETGADAIATGNPGCTLQIGRHLQLLGEPRPIHHPIELLARSLETARLPSRLSRARDRRRAVQ